MKLNPGILCITAILFSACKSDSKSEKPAHIPIEGTWQLVSGLTIQQGDSTITDYKKGQKQIKIINDTHFAFLNHDLNQGKEGHAVFVAGGGKYTLQGEDYTEHLEYCNYREWEDKIFDFKVTISNDTLIQRGIEKVEELGVNREILEKYVRLAK